MKFAKLRVTCTPRENEEKGPKRPVRTFLFHCGMTAESTEGAKVRNATVRAKAELGEEAVFYNVTRVVEV